MLFGLFGAQLPCAVTVQSKETVCDGPQGSPKGVLGSVEVAPPIEPHIQGGPPPSHQPCNATGSGLLEQAATEKLLSVFS